MTMLQKLENTYLSILRFTVILIAGLLLVSAAFFMMNGLPALMAAPSADVKPPQITADEISVHMPDDKPKKPSEPKASATSSPSAAASSKSENAEEVFSEKITSVIFNFVREKSGGTLRLDANHLKEVIRKAADEQASPELAAAYIKYLATSIEQILNSPQVQTMLQTPDSIAIANTATDSGSADPNDQNPAVYIINKLLTKYRDKFETSVNTQRKANARAIARHANAQANALISLYAAMGSFAIFILVVFMSIFIKIERNLRPQAI